MKILIVKTSSLGDIIHCFPALHLLRKKFPLAEIHWVVERPFASLLEAHPSVDKVITVDTRSWRRLRGLKSYSQFVSSLDSYDMLFDFQGNCKSGLITWRARAKVKVGFGCKTVAEWPNILATNRRFNPPPGQNIREDYLHLVRSALSDFETQAEQQVVLKGDAIPLNLPRPMTLVCPGSAWPNKQLHPTTLKAFLKNLSGSLIYVYGSDQERQFVEELSSEIGGYILDKVSLPDLQATMRQMDLVIAMDSLPLHLAGTTHTPTYSFFGPSLAEKYRPIGPQHKSFQGSCPYGQTFDKRCPILRTCKTGACIRGDSIHIFIPQ